jgi:hypothetical protein
MIFHVGRSFSFNDHGILNAMVPNKSYASGSFLFHDEWSFLLSFQSCYFQEHYSTFLYGSKEKLDKIKVI